MDLRGELEAYLCRRLQISAADAEVLATEAIAEHEMSGRRYDSDRRARASLFVRARLKGMNLLRDRRRFQAAQVGLARSSSGLSDSPTPEEALLLKELRKAILDAAATRLDAQERLVVRRYLKFVQMNVIADELGVDPSTVSRWFASACAKLAIELRDYRDILHLAKHLSTQEPDAGGEDTRS